MLWNDVWANWPMLGFFALICVAWLVVLWESS